MASEFDLQSTTGRPRQQVSPQYDQRLLILTVKSIQMVCYRWCQLIYCHSGKSPFQCQFHRDRLVKVVDASFDRKRSIQGTQRSCRPSWQNWASLHHDHRFDCGHGLVFDAMVVLQTEYVLEQLSRHLVGLHAAPEDFQKFSLQNHHLLYQILCLLAHQC